MTLPTLRAFRTVIVDIIWVKQRKYMHNILVKIEQLFMIIISIIIVIKSILHGEKPQRLTFYIDFIILFIL